MCDMWQILNEERKKTQPTYAVFVFAAAAQMIVFDCFLSIHDDRKNCSNSTANYSESNILRSSNASKMGIKRNYWTFVLVWFDCNTSLCFHPLAYWHWYRRCWISAAAAVLIYVCHHGRIGRFLGGFGRRWGRWRWRWGWGVGHSNSTQHTLHESFRYLSPKINLPDPIEIGC